MFCEITYDGLPILGGVDITEEDHAFIGQKYPQEPPDLAAMRGTDWPASDDVEVTI